MDILVGWRERHSGQEEEQETKAQEAEKSEESGRQPSGWKGRRGGARSLNYKIRGSKFML